MRIKIAPDDPQSMSQDGDAILRSLQNKSLPMADLMVRESLQNSLDASLENVDKTIVNFKVGHFESEKLAKYFEGISDVLLERHSGSQKYVSISDRNTTGLTGEYLSNDIDILNSSNFHKLVFGIGKNQSKEGAGGSWGLGKTSYFRMGIGVVIYYTRIKIRGNYEERLIASLIESPKNERRVLPKSDRGIAWWGTYNDENERIISPVTNEADISEVLDVFGIKRYQGEESGTTIVIPYVGELHQTEENDERMPWEYKDNDILSIAVQRWYVPRILNDSYTQYTDNSKLECYVNDSVVLPEMNTEPIFNVFRDLYNAAVSEKNIDETITVKSIKLGQRAMKNKDIPVGTIAFKEVSKEDLKMKPPHNKKSALEFLGFKEKDISDKNNYKIMAYSRSPGMIIEYDVDGDWFPKEMIQKEDHLLCAFFVPNSKGELSKIFTDKNYINLEAYLRSTENADHANWIDEDGFTIVQRTKNYTSRAIMQEYQTGEDRVGASATSALSRKFGSMLMPPTGFGKSSAQNKRGKKKNSTATSRNRKSNVSVLNSVILDDDKVSIKVKLNLKDLQKYKVFLEVMSQEKKMRASEWDKIMGDEVEFPFTILNADLKQDNNKASQSVDDLSIDHVSDEIIIENKVKKNLEIELEIIIKTNSDAFTPRLAIRSL